MSDIDFESLLLSQFWTNLFETLHVGEVCWYLWQPESLLGLVKEKYDIQNRCIHHSPLWWKKKHLALFLLMKWKRSIICCPGLVYIYLLNASSALLIDFLVHEQTFQREIWYDQNESCSGQFKIIFSLVWTLFSLWS